MNKKLLFAYFLFSLIIASCSSEDNGPAQENNDTFKVNSNTEDLQSSVKRDGAGVVGITSITKNDQRQNIEGDLPQVSNIALEQIGFIQPPSVDGSAMRATHIDLDGNYAYVAYTKEGSEYLGGIDIIDISDTFNPRLLNRMTNSYADINALFYQDGNIYFTGAYHDGFAGSDRAMMGSVETSNGTFTSKFSLKTQMTGQTGVDILPANNSIISLTGSDGILGVYKMESGSNIFETQLETEISDLRSAAYKNGNLIVLSGESGLLQLNTSTSDLAVEKTIAIENLASEAKRTISFYNDLVMVSEGANGVGIYDLSAGALATRLPVKFLDETGVNPEYKVTNAVSVAEDFILMANGGAGIGITRLNENLQISEEGVLEITGSSNYVKADGDYIFVASGSGGLRILKMSKPVSSQSAPNFIDCAAAIPYNDGPNLNVNSNEEKSFSGTATINHLNVNEKLNFCGSLNIKHTANINSNATFNMSGALAVGVVGKNNDLNINSDAVLKIEGSLTVYGDLDRDDNSEVVGNFTDTSNKL
ncbi:hypothetical protein LB467_09480 [Salegentibacter sp. JZCK2]|uniref:hypothetical protein n=1 Tax=Salegentibacter tibetensis TaxID=2873600 RepID=UPI001CCF5982|nr:hypothetical protein [Salegentibacter tibetensis]MBZ9729916.1 hypothetical protein [Salegentibacter tibetensis]